MLIGVHPLLGPDLLYGLAAMGHGDELVIADGNFPSAFMGPKVIRADGVGGVALVEAVLTHFPLDTFAEVAAWRMAVVGDPTAMPPICIDYQNLVHKYAGARFAVEPLERFAFYERAKTAAYIVATGETRIYANLILKKGVVPA